MQRNETAQMLLERLVNISLMGRAIFCTANGSHIQIIATFTQIMRKKF